MVDVNKDCVTLAKIITNLIVMTLNTIIFLSIPNIIMQDNSEEDNFVVGKNIQKQERFVLKLKSTQLRLVIELRSFTMLN